MAAIILFYLYLVYSQLNNGVLYYLDYAYVEDIYIRVLCVLGSILKAVVKYVGGFWPIGVFFAGYRSFFFVPSRQTQTKARL